MFPSPSQEIAHYCHDNILLLPDGLHEFAAARAVMVNGASGVFHKLIRDDMRGIEFFTNAPCLAYVVQGRERFHDPEGAETVVTAGDMLLMPRHMHMVSDFRNADGPLEAWLFFFNDAVVAEYLQATSPRAVAAAPRSRTARFAGSACLKAYVEALPRVYGAVAAPPVLVKAKLVELLMLLHLQDRQDQLHGFLVSQNAGHARRNIRQVMREQALADLTVADYARLSGRSLSSFQRDFKREFGESPSVWLRRVRLERAHEMVTTSGVSITEIAQHTGYADTSHFIKAYKAHYAATPKQTRQRLS